MIGISKITQDVDGFILIDENYASVIYDAPARVNRQATLDGGVVIDHQGVAAGDRSPLSVRCNLTEDEIAIVRGLFENETFITIATRDGCYTGVISKLSGDNGDITISLMIRS